MWGNILTHIGLHHTMGAVDVTAMRLENLQQLTFIERVFADLLKIHQVDHCKGNNLFCPCKGSS